MIQLPAALALVFFTTLPVLPHPSYARGQFTPSAFGFPTAMTLIPRSVFTTQTPRSWEVARCVQYLVWAWAVVTCVQALGRTVRRVQRRSLKLDDRAASAQAKESSPTPTSKSQSTATDAGKNETASASRGGAKVETTESKSNNDKTTTTTYTPRPFWTALLLHLISWRLATSLIQPNLPGAWAWPFDPTTLIGLGTGLACSWAEVWRLLRIAGLVSEEEGTRTRRPRKLARLFHAVLSAHRLLLGVGVLSATLDRSGEIKPLPGLA